MIVYLDTKHGVHERAVRIVCEPLKPKTVPSLKPPIGDEMMNEPASAILFNKVLFHCNSQRIQRDVTATNSLHLSLNLFRCIFFFMGIVVLS